jgi:hypothetical protein
MAKIHIKNKKVNMWNHCATKIQSAFRHGPIDIARFVGFDTARRVQKAQYNYNRMSP